MSYSRHSVMTLSGRLGCAALLCAITAISLAATEEHFVLQALDKKTQPSPSAQTQQDCAEAEPLRKNVQRLRAEVERLKREVKQLEKHRQVDFIRDQLMKEEQRAETLQLRLLDVAEKQANLQTRLTTVDQQLSPENIDRVLAGVGSLRPEETREGWRRRLNFERQGILGQLDLLRQERIRLQASLATADASIQRLRLRLSEALTRDS